MDLLSSWLISQINMSLLSKDLEDLIQEMADRGRWQTEMEGKSGSKREWKRESSAREVLKKFGQQCDGGVHMPPSWRIKLMKCNGYKIGKYMDAVSPLFSCPIPFWIILELWRPVSATNQNSLFRQCYIFQKSSISVLLTASCAVEDAQKNS